jgi:hypothetical protein
MDQSALLKLKAAAAQANSLADDYERGRLWEGELQRQIYTIIGQLQIAAAAARRAGER